MRSRQALHSLLAAAALCAALAPPRAAAQARAAWAPEAAGAAGAAPAPPSPGGEIRVEFEGNRAFDGERLREVLAECRGRLAVSERNRGLALIDYCVRTDLRELLLRSGYVRARVGTPRPDSSGRPEVVTVSVEENELYRLGEVRVEGAEFFAAERLRELLALKAGEVADAAAVTRWLGERLRGLYRGDGFVQYQYEVRPVFRLEPFAAEGVVDFAVRIEEGRRYKFGGLAFEAKGEVPPEALREAAALEVGEPFSARRLAEVIERVDGLGLFVAVKEEDVEFKLDEKAGALEIRIRLKERAGESPPPPQ